jgi:hypothetical protein
MKRNRIAIALLSIGLVAAPRVRAQAAPIIIGSVVVGTGLGWWIMHVIRSGAEAPDELTLEYSDISELYKAGHPSAELLPRLDAYIAKVELDSSSYFKTPVLRNNYRSAERLRTILKEPAAVQ